MTITSLKKHPAVAGNMVGELITEARVDALNGALAENGIDASQIIAVFELPGVAIANAVPARFRVLYRTR